MKQGGAPAASSRVAALAATLSLAFACSRDGVTHAPPANPPAPSLVDAASLAQLKTLALKSAGPRPDPTNRFADDPKAAALGQALFFHRGFSGALLEGDNDGTAGTLGKRGEAGRVACSDCHVPKDAFTDTRSRGRQISLAAEWGVRRAPSLLNAGQRRLFTWVGKADTSFAQAVSVFENEREMNSSRLFVAQETFRSFREQYEAVFGTLPPLDDAQRFPPLAPELAGCEPKQLQRERTCRGRPGDRAHYDRLTPEDRLAVDAVVANVGKALGAYVRLLGCGPGRFDAFLDGDASALNESEQRGAALFVGRGRCVRCHSGPYLSDFAFHNVGLRPTPVAVAFVDAGDTGAFDGFAEARRSTFNSKGPHSDGDDGRLPGEISERMQGAFQTPMLRCTSKNPSFMHTGQFRTLEAVVDFFNAGGDYQGYPGKSEIAPLRLSSIERRDLVAFLRALDGPGPPDALLEPPAARERMGGTP